MFLHDFKDILSKIDTQVHSSKLYIWAFLPIVKRLVDKMIKWNNNNIVTITPNLITLLGGICHILTFSFATTRRLAPFKVLLFFLGFILDACDGELARKEKQFSIIGSELDHSIDSITQVAMAKFLYDIYSFGSYDNIGIINYIHTVTYAALLFNIYAIHYISGTNDTFLYGTEYFGITEVCIITWIIGIIYSLSGSNLQILLETIRIIVILSVPFSIYLIYKSICTSKRMYVNLQYMFFLILIAIHLESSNFAIESLLLLFVCTLTMIHFDSESYISIENVSSSMNILPYIDYYILFTTLMLMIPFKPLNKIKQPVLYLLICYKFFVLIECKWKVIHRKTTELA